MRIFIFPLERSGGRIFNTNQNYPPYFSKIYVLSFYPRIFSTIFFAHQVSSTIDAWQIFKSSYDETIKNLFISSHSLTDFSHKLQRYRFEIFIYHLKNCFKFFVLSLKKLKWFPNYNVTRDVVLFFIRLHV